MGGTKPQASPIKKTGATSSSSSSSHLSILTKSNLIGPSLVAICSVPVAIFFALISSGWSLGYIFGIIAVGILTSLDLRRTIPKAVLGSAVTLLAIAYTIANTDLGGRISIPNNNALTSLIIGIPPAVAVALSALLFYRPQRFKVLFQNLIGTAAIGIGLGLSIPIGSNANSMFTVLLAIIFFVGVGLAANFIQTGLIFVLELFWQVRKLSMNMMPTMFFSYNAIVGYAYFVAPSPDREFVFLSSLGFLPLICIIAVLLGKLTVKYSPPPPKTISPKLPTSVKTVPPVLPKIVMTGDHLLRQGDAETLKIVTESSGQAKDIGPVIATVQFPNGKREPLHLTRMSKGSYSMKFRPDRPGNYSVQIGIGNKHYQSVHETFSFTVQPAQATLPPSLAQPKAAAPAPTPAPPSRNVFQQAMQTVSKIISPPPTPTPVKAQPRTGLPGLDSWDPKVWLNQDVHGYLVKEHIATGASGYVLRATFGSAGTEMALKIPILKTTSGSTALEETMSEATRLLELSGQSKYIVQIRGMLVDRLNVQEIVKGDTGLYYHSPPTIVMEYMKGGTAKRLVEDSEYESLYYSEKWGNIVVVIGQMISTGLDVIHQAGFVHLDVKPQNILFNMKPPTTGQDMLDQMLSGALLPKLSDLGSAVRTGGKVGQFTSEYAPVEQVLNEPADPSMDVYALGASMYTLLSRSSVHDKDLINLMNNATNNPASTDQLRNLWKSSRPDFTKIEANFSGVLPILKKMLENDPDHRPEAAEVAVSLQKLVKR